MKKIAQVLLLTLAFPLYGRPITINNPADYHILDQFFRTMIKEEVFGYVLEGTKPLSALNIYPNNYLIFPHSRFFQWNILAEEAIEKWKQIAPEQKDFVFKIAEVFNHKFGGSYHELLFINRKKMQEIVDDNFDLFRLLLGPTIDNSSLAKFIADSPQPLDTIIKSNNTLMGILLGYGTHNSLMGGRLEEIEGSQGSLDLPPFSGDTLSQKAREKVDWNLQNYFLAAVESSTHDVAEKLFVKPGLGCVSLQEETEKITSQKEKVPLTLLKEKPTFILGAYRNKDNKKLFEIAQSSQKKIQILLSRPDLLEYVLEKITGEKPVINCSITSSNIRLPINGNGEAAVAEVVWQMAQELDKETIPTFIEAFCRCDPAENKKPKLRMVSGVLSGLKQAQSNLQVADAQLLTWCKTKDLKEIVPQGLYFECIKSGQGKSIDTSTDILVSYVIEDGLNHVLAAQHKSWIDLSQAIPAFAHGIKGMQEGETRKIYIHPKYGYGALTTLSPCVSLRAKVTLHQINAQAKGSLPPLTPIDLAWVNDPKFFEKVKEASYQNARYLGNLWGVWLNKSSDMDFFKLCNQLKQQAENKEERPLAKGKQRLCNRVFWNLITQVESRPEMKGQN